MTKNRSKSGSGAKAAQHLQPVAPIERVAPVDSSREDASLDADDPQTAAVNETYASHEQDDRSLEGDASASAEQSEDSAETTSATAAAFNSASDAAAAAFGSDDLGDINSQKAEPVDAGDQVMRIPVDWGGEFETSFCGLKNAGNTCFLNSVGMMLVHCPGVFWHCMFDLEQRENSDEHYFHSRGRYDDAIKQLVYGTQNEAYMPTPLIRLTRAIMPDYRYGTQQDAHEYLRLLLSAWAEDYGLKPEEFMQSPAYGCFAGCYSSWCRCLTCGEESRKYSADLDLSVEIMQFVDEKQGWVVFHELSECFRSYFKSSKLAGDNQWFCPKCQEKRDSEHGMSIYSPPPFLCINLKRFSNDIEKIGQRVRFPQRLSLAPYMDPAAPAPAEDEALQCQYKLSGVVVHSGLSIRDGHYISYCLGIPDRVADAESESESGLQRRKQGGKKESSSEMKKSSWFRYNDEVITKVSLEEVLGSEAYILM